MRETKLVSIVVMILILLGVASILISIFFSFEFNFYKSEISVNGNNIQEKLFYNTDKDYHTLFRNFVSPVLAKGSTPYFESIEVTSISCQDGNPYVYTNDGKYLSYNQNALWESKTQPYTERNEYGCTFGNIYGFEKNNEYWIQADYLVNGNLFKIKGDYYKKFVVYSPNRHKLLTRDKNFFISGDNVITKNMFLPNEYVIIYIPFNGTDVTNYQIIEKNDFEFDNSYLTIFIVLFISFFPALIFIIIWYFFGKELTNPDLPNELSMYPNERKAWEVAAIFNPPFGQPGKTFFSTMIMDFYRRKIIDMKNVGKEVYIKLLKYDKQKLDEVELEFALYLETIIELGNKKHIDKDGFFKVKKMVDSISMFNKHKLTSKYVSLTKKIKEKSKSYIDKKGQIVAILVLFPVSFIFFWLLNKFILINNQQIIFLMIIFIGLFYLSFSTSIFIRFKENYYEEYLKWQGFRKYIKSFSTMKSCPPQALKLWQQHLIYATSLGVSAVILKKFKDWKVIDQNHYTIYHTATAFNSSSFGNTSGGGAGGMGGAGGGGSGGGGGGGR
ncbi:MAG TPA: DUF2207 domain-containing protein [Candidatus Paceibacterota bacterium]|nr:DUF2207 domain-containing protein [Candidatus Paceibacterota bacterium]